MLFHHRAHRRPFHWGPYPTERLPRRPALDMDNGTAAAANEYHAAPGPLGAALARYRELFLQFAQGEPAPEQAPLPDDLERRAVDVKGVCYFLDADQVGIARIPEQAWTAEPQPEHDHAIVILVAHGRLPEPGNLARAWVEPARQAMAELRLAEIGAALAGHVRMLGYPARLHLPGATGLDLERLAVAAGLALRTPDGLRNPFLGREFSLALVSTSYACATDLPLAEHALSGARGLAFWWGVGGARSGREWRRRARRATHLSQYPMEQIKRVARPTTLILDDEVPRVPKRAAFFERALQGDLGAKSQRERGRFAFKHPLSHAQLAMIRAMVPHQDGPVAPTHNPAFSDPAGNARAIKSLAHLLGADLAGICEIPRYAWFSHHADGQPIQPYHRYAVVMLIDQGYETMEAASGDDWISGAQSMRGYLRGAEIAGIMAETLRAEGYSARSQTNADSDVLHIPLILWAGLGELSRIGELVLNPFVGPRFKSVVLTTDLPLEVDQPIDFGLQTFCSGCLKCARECPCDAIPYGPKVMFNAYEIWKPDVERCTRYRLTNSKGSACGRCMKTCPLNKIVDADGALLSRIASWLGIHAMFLKPLLVPIATRLDDWLGHGRRNLVKKWWFDHEVIDGVTQAAKATNARDIDPAKTTEPAKQTIAYYHANMMPPPNAPTPVPLDRKAALAAKDQLETIENARHRHAAGQPAPAHYTPTPSLADAASAVHGESGPYRPAVK